MSDFWTKAVRRDGVSTLIKLAKLVCKIVGLYGTVKFATRTSFELANAMEAVRVACLAWEALDDHAGVIDRTTDVDEPFDGVPEG